MLAFAVLKDGTPQNFTEKTFMNSHKTSKFTKVFSLESFWLLGLHVLTHVILLVSLKRSHQTFFNFLVREGGGLETRLRPHSTPLHSTSRFATNALVGVGIREQRKIKRRSKGTTKPLMATLDITPTRRKQLLPMYLH